MILLTKKEMAKEKYTKKEIERKKKNRKNRKKFFLWNGPCMFARKTGRVGSYLDYSFLPKKMKIFVQIINNNLNCYWRDKFFWGGVPTSKILMLKIHKFT